MNERILLASPTMHTEELNFIKEAFDKNWIAPLGFNCDMFEKEIAQYLAKGQNTVYHTLALSSGTAALHLACKLAGIVRGDTVFCSDMTFAATVNPISYEGGIQVFIDSERETWNMDPIALEKAFEKYPKTKVVVLAHLYGTPAKIDEILQVCNRRGAILIEDAAEAMSSTYKGRECGTFGKYNVISFNGNKIITTSGGGMFITDDKQARDRAYYLSTQAREKADWYEHKEIGYNYRMSNVVAGIGRGQLLHLQEHRDRKEKIYLRYKEGLRDLPITMNPYSDQAKPNFWLSCLTINKEVNISPMTLFDKLNAKNIETRPMWKPMHMQPIFKGLDFVTVEKNPVSEDIFARGLCLPSDIKMTEDVQDYVINAIRDCF